MIGKLVLTDWPPLVLPLDDVLLACLKDTGSDSSQMSFARITDCEHDRVKPVVSDHC